MTDAPTVAELDAPSPAARERRFLPWLWVLVAALLVAGVVSALVVDGERSGSERLAAAAAGVDDAGSFAYTLTLASTGPFSAAFEIEGQVRRHRTNLTLGETAGVGSDVGLVTTIEPYDYGKAVTIEIPPAGDVHEAGPGGLESLFAPGPPVAESFTD